MQRVNNGQFKTTQTRPHAVAWCRALPRLITRLAIPVLLLILITSQTALANRPKPKQMPSALPLTGEATEQGIRITWTEAEPKFAGSVEVSRRQLGGTGSDTWTVIAPTLGLVQTYLDTDAKQGIAWEYRVRRLGRKVIDQGFWTGGIDVSMPEQRGLAVIVVETNIANRLSPELDRFANDLTGDGWTVERIAAKSGRKIDKSLKLVTALEIKVMLRQLRAAHPDGKMAVILVGSVPMVQSGRIAPDGHKAVPHATDLFYADLNSRWPTTTDGTLFPSTIPDGRIEASVGRIDFSNMGKQGNGKEIDRLKAYFDRNHAWRHNKIDVPRKAYAGRLGHLFVERDGLANIVGPGAIASGGHADTGQTGRWLFGVDFGPANSAAYFKNFAAAPVFAINFGSNKQKIDRPANPMNALLTPPNSALAVAWGGRPAWRLHGMAVGETIGDAQIRTVNNGPQPGGGLETVDYLPTGAYPFVYPVWGNLLGDPTLHAFPVTPPASVTLVPETDGMRIKWDDKPTIGDVVIYRLDADGTQSRIGMGKDGTSGVLDPEGTLTSRYMARHAQRIAVPAGTILALSQGVFTQ